MSSKPKYDKTLLIIDPQVDFHEGGSLAVNGAMDDSARIASMIKQHIDSIDEIYVTLDSHHRIHIAHAIFWKNDQGEKPPPFTLITYDDVQHGIWQPRNPELLSHCLQYTYYLRNEGKFTLCIWPEHCLIGTIGHTVIPSINAALQDWCGYHNKEVHYIQKGMNSLTEMYSAMKAEYVIENDATTHLNSYVLMQLASTQQLLVCGEAVSHCVRFTFMDILGTWPVNQRHRLVLLTDASSPVRGFESQGEEFVKTITEAGCTLSTTTTIFNHH